VLTTVPTPDTLVLPALHSQWADVPTTVLTVAALTAHQHWLTADDAEAHTDVFAVRRWSASATAVVPTTPQPRAAIVLLPLPAPSSPRVYGALLRPWRAWYGGFAQRATRRARRRELLLFLAWARATYLLAPHEVRETTLVAYARWLETQAAARLLARATARRRVATARAALVWRAGQVAAFRALRAEFGVLDATA
jgi:hypothetical protein